MKTYGTAASFGRQFSLRRRRRRPVSTPADLSDMQVVGGGRAELKRVFVETSSERRRSGKSNSVCH